MPTNTSKSPKSPKNSNNATGRAVVVTTKDKGIFFGRVVDESNAPRTIKLRDLRNCLYYPQAVKGFLGLAVSGPLAGSRVGPSCPEPCDLYDLTGIFTCTPEAIAAWERGSWS